MADDAIPRPIWKPRPRRRHQRPATRAAEHLRSQDDLKVTGGQIESSFPGDANVPETRRTALVLLLLMVTCMLDFACNVHAQEEHPLEIMPLPAHVEWGNGELAVDGSFGVALEGYRESRLERARQRFLNRLSRETGIPLWRDVVENQVRFTIRTAGASKAVQQLGEDESYHLAITTTNVQLTAANPLGVLRGLDTFLQLVRITPRGFRVPVVVIDDKPRFPWRGLLIDSGHRFIPVPDVKRNLDGMETVKLNVFHWRFADNQGFHIESKRYPLLQKKGSGGFITRRRRFGR